jgi:hypothetical protein
MVTGVQLYDADVRRLQRAVIERTPAATVIDELLETVWRTGWGDRLACVAVWAFEEHQRRSARIVSLKWWRIALRRSRVLVLLAIGIDRRLILAGLGVSERTLDGDLAAIAQVLIEGLLRDAPADLKRVRVEPADRVRIPALSELAA